MTKPITDHCSPRKFELMSSSRHAGFVGQDSSICFGCNHDASGMIDDVNMIADEGSSLQRHPGLWVGNSSCR